MICEPGGSGWILPLYEGQIEWPSTLHGVLCALAMIYSFLGVAIVADAFVSSIEAITSRRKQKHLKNGQMMTWKVWNETVATLSLMALGSSAPEIFLSVMDLFKKEFHFSPLGASTIVGSAAFNLLVIVGVCMAAIPSNEVRRISDLPGFYVTAFFSILAYVWLVVILVNITPNVVDMWEAIVTLLLCPVLIYVSYKVNIGDCDFILNAVGLKRTPEEKESGEAEKSETATIRLMSENQVLNVEATSEAQTVDIGVSISTVGYGDASCSYHTEALTAVPGCDYEESEGELSFTSDAGCLKQYLKLAILPGDLSRPPRRFLVILDSAEGANFDPDHDGGEESAVLSVTISPPTTTSEYWKSASSFRKTTNRVINVDLVRKAFEDWPDQFREAAYCNGSAEDQKEASISDWIQHLFALPWKVLWAILPPTAFFGGWACFYAALLGIAVMSALLSDLAEMFGCVLGIPDIVTAVSFVALGTSVPDLFASLSATRADATADAAIINVTGSNSVNVFLGLGLPWTCGTIYWAVVGRTAEWEAFYPEEAKKMTGAAFIVATDDLGFSVLVFIATCIVALVLLFFRRKCVGGELGGNYNVQVASVSAFFGMWIGFILIVSWRVLRKEDTTPTENLIVLITSVFVMIALAAWPLIVMMRYWRKNKFRKMSFALEPAKPGARKVGEQTPPVAENCEANAGDLDEFKEESAGSVGFADVCVAKEIPAVPATAGGKRTKQFLKEKALTGLSVGSEDLGREPTASTVKTLAVDVQFWFKQTSGVEEPALEAVIEEEKEETVRQSTNDSHTSIKTTVSSL